MQPSETRQHPNSPVLIGFAGPAQAGKSTAATAAQTLLLDSHVFAFADPVKDGLNAIFRTDFRGPTIENDKEAKWDWLGQSPRMLMQTIATEWGRNIVHPDLWVLLTEQRVLETPNLRYAIFQDVRFENERRFIHDNGGFIIHVHRPYGKTTDLSQHVSESGIALNETCGDVIVLNDSTISALQVRVHAAIRLFLMRNGMVDIGSLS